MNYIDMVNQIWFLNKEHCFKPSELALYFHLLDVSNSLGWKNPFKQGNLIIGVTIGISEPVLQRSREKLVRAGVISFKSGRVKGELTEYTLIDLGIKKLYLSKYQSNTLSKYPTDAETGDINKDKPEVNKNFINISSEQVFEDEFKNWFENKFRFQKDNWQKLFPLANIDNCLDEFMLARAFETFNDLEHFKRSFGLKLKNTDEQLRKKKNERTTTTKKPITENSSPGTF